MNRAITDRTSVSEGSGGPPAGRRHDLALRYRRAAGYNGAAGGSKEGGRRQRHGAPSPADGHGDADARCLDPGAAERRQRGGRRELQRHAQEDGVRPEREPGAQQSGDGDGDDRDGHAELVRFGLPLLAANPQGTRRQLTPATIEEAVECLSRWYVAELRMLSEAGNGHSEPGANGAGHQATAAETAQAFERLAARYVAELQLLSEEFYRRGQIPRLNGQLLRAWSGEGGRQPSPATHMVPGSNGTAGSVPTVVRVPVIVESPAPVSPLVPQAHSPSPLARARLTPLGWWEHVLWWWDGLRSAPWVMSVVLEVLALALVVGLVLAIIVTAFKPLR